MFCTIKMGVYAMSYWSAILMGIVQGLTEFLPLSSSGHLTILDNLFGLNLMEEGHALFFVLLHIGTLLSILIAYWEDISRIILESLTLLGLSAGPKQSRYPAARVGLMLLISTLPLFLLLPLRRQINALAENNYFVAISLILTGCMLVLIGKMSEGKKIGSTMTVFDALLIGICQLVSALPGISRVGTTLTAGVSLGLRKEFAANYALLLSIPALLGSQLLALVDALNAGVELGAVPMYLAGMATAMLVGLGAIMLLRLAAKRGKFGGFAYYCWVAGVLTIILTLIF